jgi:hypothetical protein
MTLPRIQPRLYHPFTLSPLPASFHLLPHLLGTLHRAYDPTRTFWFHQHRPKITNLLAQKPKRRFSLLRVATVKDLKVVSLNKMAF